jgi:hypothetical protein
MQFVWILIVLAELYHSSVDDGDIFALAYTNENVQNESANARTEEYLPRKPK